MASVTHAGGKPSASNPIARKALFERSRCDTSLVLLTKRFAELMRRSTDGLLDLNQVAQQLNAPKRRIYDVTNVLEGIQLIRKKSKSNIQWLGGQASSYQDLSALIEEERKLDELILSCTRQAHQLCEDSQCLRYAYLTYEDIRKIPSLKEQTVIVIKAPADTKLEVPHPEESLQVHLCSTQGPIEVFICSDDPVNMEATHSSAASGATGGHFNSTASRNDLVLNVPSMSFVQVSSKDDANHSFGIRRLSEPTQHSSPVTVTPAHPAPTSLTSLQPPSEDQHSFVTLNPPLTISIDGGEYLLSLAEDEGITDLFSSVDLDHSPVDMPLL